MHRNLPSCDLERNCLVASADCYRDLGPGRTLHPADHAVLRESDSRDVLVPDFEDPVALLQTDLLGRTSRDDFQHDGRVVRHVELDADSIEIAGQVGLSLCQLDRWHIDRMRIQLCQRGCDGSIGDFPYIDRVNIVLVDLVKDQIQLAPVSVLYTEHIPFLAVGVVGQHNQRAHDYSHNGDPDGRYSFHPNLSFQL